MDTHVLQESELTIEIKLVTTVYDGDGNELIRIDEVLDRIRDRPCMDSSLIWRIFAAVTAMPG
jgi:hypothetical protein